MDKSRAQAMAFVAVSSGKAKQGTPNSSGLARLNYASRLQDIAAVSRCWVPGPRIIQVQGNIRLLCENQIRRHLGTSRIGCFIQLTFEQHDLNCMDPLTCWRWKWQPTPVFLPRGSHGQRGLVGCCPQCRTESDTTEVTQHALEKKMATHSSIPAWRIPGTEEPGGLPSTGSHRVRHD